MPDSRLKDLPFVLRPGDSDVEPAGETGRVYGGRLHLSPHTSNWVARLQAELFRLKFGLNPSWGTAGHENTKQEFDDTTAWAVREFQMAAKLPNAEHATTGAEVPLAGDADYHDGEPVSGVVNALTRKALIAWAEQNLSCPVQVAILNSSGQPQPDRDNLWRDNELSVQVRVHARDRSRHYSPVDGTPTTPRDLTAFQPVGAFLQYLGNFGPATNENQAWKNDDDLSEVLPERFFVLPGDGEPDTQARRARLLSTFRVIRAVADAECRGFFEGGNGYDDQVISFGLCHWTIPPGVKPRNPLGRGELPAFLAYLRHRDPVGFERGFGRFGLGTHHPWSSVAGSADGRDLHVPDVRLFTTAPTEHGEDGTGVVPPIGLAKRRNLRYWHWYYRFVMAGRTIDGYHRAMWDMARMRLRDLLSVEWPAHTGGDPFPFVGATAPGRRATLGETFRSERTVAMLLRWHTKRPAHVAKTQTDQEDTVLELQETYRAIRGTAPFANHSVGSWTSSQEIALAEALLARFEQYVDNDATMRTEIRPWLDPDIAADRGYRLPRSMPGLAAPFNIVNQPPNPAFAVLTGAAGPGNWQAIAAQSPLRAPFVQAGVTLSAHAQFSRITPQNHINNAVWQVQDRDQHGARTRLFRLRRLPAQPPTIEVTEYPTLSLARDSFSLDVAGLPIRLPATTATAPLVEIQGAAGQALLEELDAPSGGGGGIAGAVLAALGAVLREKLPETDIQFAAITVPRLEERNEAGDTKVRWTVPTSDNPNLTHFTVRRVATDHATVDPPGVSLRYRGSPLSLEANSNSTDVLQLRKDLRALGFRSIPQPTGAAADNQFDRPLQAAVRAFQAYARRARVGKQAAATGPQVKRLVSVEVPEPVRYAGPVSGVVDRATTAIIEHWLSLPQLWRCPVVVDARTQTDEGPPSSAVVVTDLNGALLDNLWGPDADTDPSHFLFVTDFSEPGAVTCRRLGIYRGGPKVVNVGAFAPAQAEITAQRLTGQASPAGATLSTAKVIRAVAKESPCGGFLDGVDATDADRLLTFGWFDLKNALDGTNVLGGLGVLFSLARELEPRPYFNLVGRDAIRESRSWSDAAALKRILQGDANAKLISGVARQDGGGDYTAFVKSEDADEWRGWHSVYRLLRAGRSDEVARAVWDLTRVQLLRLAGIPLRQPFAAALKALATSEKSWAVLFFWHLRFPQEVVTRPAVKKDAEAADPVEEAVQDSGLTAPPTDDAEEAAIRAALVAKAKALHPGAAGAAFRDALDRLVADAAGLSGAFGSFELDLDHRPHIPRAAGQGIITAAVRIGPKPAAGGGGQSRFQLALAGERDPNTARLRLTHALFGVPNEGGPAGSQRCVRVPLLQAAENLDLPIEEDAGTTAIVSDAPGADPEELPVFRVVPGSNLAALQALPLAFNPAALLGAGARVSAARLELTGLSFDGNGEIQGKIRGVVDPGTPFGRLPVIFAANGDNGLAPAPDFTQLTWDAAAGTISADANTAGNETIGAKLLSLAGWPLELPRDQPFSMSAAAAGDSFAAQLSSSLDRTGLDLVPTLVRLTLEQVRLLFDSESGLSVSLREGADRAKGFIAADIFADATERIGNDVFERYVNHLYEKIGGAADALGKLFALLPADASGVLLAAGSRLVSWDGRGRAELESAFLRGLTKVGVNEARRFRTFAGEVFGDTTPTMAKFAEKAGRPADIARSAEDGSWRVTVPLVIKLNDERDHASPAKDIFRVEGAFSFRAEGSNDGASVRFGAGSFSVEPTVVLAVEEDGFEKGRSFGGFLSLHVPKGTTFVLSTNLTKTSLVWDRQRTLARTSKKILLRAPASASSEADGVPFDPDRPEKKRFTFEMEEFGLTERGFDLKGAVRVENVSLNDSDGDLDQQTQTGLKAPLAVQRPEVAQPKESGGANGNSSTDGQDEPVGTIEFKNSRLVRGSVRAGFQLRLFDDAKGTITFLFAEDPRTKSLSIVGTVEINTAVEYRLEDLLCTFQIRALKLRLSYTKTGSTVAWSGDGTITGAAKFLPSAGGSVSGPLAALADFFAGVTCEFEDLNPVKLGRGATFTFHFPPKTFTLANVMEVDLNGITIGDNRQSGDNNLFGLLGDVRLKNLPGINGSLTFGGIDLKAKPNSLPDVSFKRIGAALTIPGGGEFEAYFDRFEDERESGFDGGMSLRTKILPPVSGSVILTEARCVDLATQALKDDRVPTLRLFTTVGHQAHLGYGFFLREFGLGLGIFRSLRNLGGASRQLPLTTRLLKFVDDPKGLPDPARRDGWEPDPPARPGKTPPNWMAIGKALITFAKYEPDKPHVVAGTLLAALDHTGKLTLGVNIWLFTSPNETSQAEFLARPAARGAIQLDPSAGKIFGAFRTLPNPKFGGNVPPLLAQVLGLYQTQLMFLADRNGFLVEVGWPWQTRINLPLPSPLRGAITSGFRYGIYRGVMVAQLNFGVDVQLDAEAGIDFRTPLGSAGARLTVRGSGFFRASLVGALDQEFRPYVLGDVRVAATVVVRAQAHAELSKKITQWCKIRLRIRFSASFNLSITAALAAAMEADGVPAFAGDAHVAVSVSGYRIAGQVPFQFRAERIPSVRNRLAEILPPPIAGFGGPPTPFALAPGGGFALTAAAAQEKGWHYRSRRVPGTNTLLVALLPEPGLDYPPLAEDPDQTDPDAVATKRFRLTLTAAGRPAYRRFLGDNGPAVSAGADGTLTWNEFFAHELIPLDKMREEYERPEDTTGEPLDPQGPRALTVALFLFGLKEASPPPSGFDDVAKERVDPRTLRPREDDSDDHTAQITPSGGVANGGSPYFRRDGEFDRVVSEACARRGPPPPGRTEPSANPGKDSVDGVSTGLLAAEVLELFENDAVGRGASPPEDNFLAPQLRVLLVFETADDVILNADDPVPLLIDLTGSKPLTVRRDQPVSLVHFASAARARGEYDLLPGNWFQSSEQVALCWDFRFERYNPAKPLEAYGPGFEFFRVTRTNVSNPSSQPKVTVLKAAWLDPSVGRGMRLGVSEELARVPFQFVDDLGDPEDPANEVRVNHELLYEVEAVVADKTKRYAFKQAIVRELIKPLGAPVVALALHKPAWGVSGGLFEDRGQVEIALMVPAEMAAGVATPDPFDPGEFRVRYRIVPAGVVGPYGLDPAAPATTRPEEGLPPGAAAGLDSPDIRFNASPQGRAMPWDETDPLSLTAGDWHPIHVILPATDEDPNPRQVLVGYRASLPVATLLAKVGSVPPGRAVELWIGRDKTAQNDPGRLLRSALVLCRHAVDLPDAATPALPAGVVRRDYFGSGSTVAALEPLPKTPLTRPDAEWFLPPAHVEHIVRPGTAVPPGFNPQTDGPVPNDARLCLTWRMPAEGGSPFDPIVGFKVHRADRFNPALHRRAGQGIRPRVEVDLGVVTESHYRANPSSVGVHPIAITVQNATEYTGDWRPDRTGGQIWAHEPPPTLAGSFDFLDDPDRPGVTLIHKQIHAVAAAITAALTALGYQARHAWNVVEPFEDRADLRIAEHRSDPALRETHFREQFAFFRAEHEPKADPYGWAIAEALGLSAEVVFLNEESGEPFDLDELVRRPRQGHDFLQRLQAAVAGLSPKPPVALSLFVAEDGVTLLNVLRLTYLGPWPRWDTPQGFDLKVALLLKLLGRDPRAAWPQSVNFSAGADIDSWLAKSVTPQLRKGFGGLDETQAVGRITFYRRDGALAPAGIAGRSPFPRVVPIERDGLVRLDLPVPDRLAHAYDIAVEPVRRYDLIRERLFPRDEQPRPGTFSPASIPYERIVPVYVPRTRPLVPHNLVATPLPGSVQGYVFAHPAEFAACASATNAAAVEYSGQTVILERRFYQDRRDHGREILEILSDRSAFPVDWALYQSYITANHYEEVRPGPELDLAPDSPNTPLAFQPVEGTRVGVFGADRYVFPDLPAYYEYRLSVFSTAGLAQSPTASSPFVRPLFDPVRQRPTTEGKFAAEFSGVNRLVVRITLVHARIHLRPEMRGLWVTSDDCFSLPGQDGADPVPVRFGSLPDLYCDYQLYLNANYQPGNRLAVPVLNPLASLVAPFDPQREQSGQVPRRFLAKSPDENRVRILPPDLSGDGAPENEVRVEQAADGAIRVVLPLRFTPESRDYIRPILQADAEDPKEFDKVLFFAVRRGGVSSRIVPQTAPTRTITEAGGATDES